MATKYEHYSQSPELMALYASNYACEILAKIIKDEVQPIEMVGIFANFKEEIIQESARILSTKYDPEEEMIIGWLGD